MPRQSQHGKDALPAAQAARLNEVKDDRPEQPQTKFWWGSGG